MLTESRKRRTMVPENTRRPGDPSQPINLDSEQKEKLRELIDILRNGIDGHKETEKERKKNGSDMSVVARLHV